MIKVTVSANEGGQRFDKLLGKILKEAPMSFIYKMLRKKNITLNGKKADGSEKTVAGDSICFFLADDTFSKFSGRIVSAETEAKKTENGITENDTTAKVWVPSLKMSEIIYEDNDILIINKPVGELSQKAEKDDISINERVVTYLAAKGIGTGEAFTPGVCNRIDRNTSGLLIAGKSLAGLQDAAELLKRHDLSKYYLCVVCGEMRKKTETDAFLLKDEKTNKVSVYSKPVEGASEIKAVYYPLIARNGATLLAVRLITGKPHQIRGHLSFLGYPLLGDVKYGYKNTEGIKLHHHLLHAYMLVFPENSLRLKEVAGKTVNCMPPKEFCNTASKLFTEEEYKNAIMEFTRSSRLRA